MNTKKAIPTRSGFMMSRCLVSKCDWERTLQPTNRLREAASFIGIAQPEDQCFNRGECDENAMASGELLERRLTKTEENNPSSGQH